jgi:hypothetical protein
MSDSRDAQVDAIYAELDRLREQIEQDRIRGAQAVLNEELRTKAALEELDRERAKVAAALELHKPVALGYNDEWECCEVCTATTAFRVRWPCVTARALGVEEA